MSFELLASIIPVWMAETIKGWNGRINVDAAIRNFGFSSRSALDKHCMKGALSKCSTHQILHIKHLSFCLSTALKRVLVNAASDSIHKNLHVHTNLKHESSNWYWYILKDSYLTDKPNQVGSHAFHGSSRMDMHFSNHLMRILHLLVSKWQSLYSLPIANIFWFLLVKYGTS